MATATTVNSIVANATINLMAAIPVNTGTYSSLMPTTRAIGFLQ